MFKKAFSHLIGEIELPNMAISLFKGDFEKMRKAHDAIHEFITLAPLCLPSQDRVSWQTKSAFLLYQYEVFCQAHRSFLEILSGYYNAGYTLLRNTLELLLKGAFWECLAHSQFRDDAKVLCEDRKGKELIRWLDDVIRLRPSIEEEFEQTSAAIFDKTAPIFEDERLRSKIIPSIPTIVKQLRAWGVFSPISPGEVMEFYNGIYKELLSAEVHVVPDRTDIGRRILVEEDFFEIAVMPHELDKYTEILLKIVDVGTVIELNILEDWIAQDGGVKAKLKGRLAVVEDLGLHYTIEKLTSLF